MAATINSVSRHRLGEVDVVGLIPVAKAATRRIQMHGHSLFGFAAAALIVGSLAGGPPPAHAEMLSFKASLNGTSEVPPNSTTGSGQATLEFDTATKQLKWTITYGGLTGAAAAAHIHGPAAAGANAAPIIPFANAASPITGTATLTDAQVADLMAGRLYVNIHTASNRPGEIRGQITR
jgi:hypothetical protein